MKSLYDRPSTTTGFEFSGRDPIKDHAPESPAGCSIGALSHDYRIAIGKFGKASEKATLHIDPLSVLVGTNASGKSNALDALLLLNRLSAGVMLTSALKGEGARRLCGAVLSQQHTSPGYAVRTGHRVPGG